jgi:hypothetical protein
MPRRPQNVRRMAADELRTQKYLVRSTADYRQLNIANEQIKTSRFSHHRTVKSELVCRTVYRTCKAAMDDIARRIELRYNGLTLHSRAGHRTKYWMSTERAGSGVK